MSTCKLAQLFVVLIYLLLPSKAAEVSADYKIAPQDVLGIDVFNEKDLSLKELRVSATGDITFPLLGTVQVAGKTTAQVEKELEAALDKDYLVNPHVIVKVHTYRIRTVNVIGSVVKQGPVELPGEDRLSIIDAISKAGGMTRLAHPDKIELIRGGVTKVYKFDELKKITNPAQTVYVEPGDTINVRESRF